MLQTVKDVCEPHSMALDYAMAEQIEHLSHLLEQAEKDAKAFFDKNYVTVGMKTLLRQGLQRLAGQSDQAVFELKQAMGGGKTHSMLALGVLARNPSLRDRVPAEITAGLKSEKAKVVAINGRGVSPEIFLWGDIADQLGKKAQFASFWKDGAAAPNKNDWIKLIGQEPTLILLDELPPYFDYAVTRPVGGGTLANVTTFALANLLEAALELKRLCIVVSNLSGTYEGASRELTKAIRDFQQEANRQAKAITPVEMASNEIYEILKKRLFKKLPPQAVVDAVATEYGKALSEAVKAKTIAKSAEQMAEEIHRSYPFHPSLKHLVALFKENESYRQTRGLMQFVSKIIKSVWERQTNDVYLLGCQHLDLNIADVREEVNRISNLLGLLLQPTIHEEEDTVEALKILDKLEGVRWDYDGEADVLYLSIGDPRAAVGIDIGEGVVVRFDEQNKEVTGLTVVGLRARLLAGLSEMAS